MAKKSRRQKLPTERDFERLKSAPSKKPERAKEDSPVEEEMPATGDDTASDVRVDANAEVDTEVPADDLPQSQPVYNIDGAMSVSLTGDVAGVKTSEKADGEDSVSADNDGSAPDESADSADDEDTAETKLEAMVGVADGQDPSPDDSTSDNEPIIEDVRDTDEQVVGRGTDVDDDEEEDEGEREEPDEDAPRPPEVLILVGSPHTDGKSALFGHKLSEYLRLSGAATTLFELAKYPVAACTGCEACSQTGLCCIKGDAWNVLSRHMDSCAALVVIAPVYFAGPSGWLKAALDRCQMYWARKYVLKDWIPRKRPAHLVVIGDGGDPYGSEPLETICTSALNCANLRIAPERIMRMIGNQYDLRNAITLAGRVMASIGRM